MWASHRNRRLVVGEDEAARRSRIEVGATDDPGCLVRHPVHAAGSPQSAHHRGEPTPVLLIQVTSTAEWKTTKVASGSASASSPGRSLSRSPASSRGGSATTRSSARSRRSARSICSGQTSEASHRRCSGRLALRGFRSSPARHTTSGSRSGSGTGPVAAHPSTIWLSPSRCRPGWWCTGSCTGPGTGTDRRWLRPRPEPAAGAVRPVAAARWRSGRARWSGCGGSSSCPRDMPLLGGEVQERGRIAGRAAEEPHRCQQKVRLSFARWYPSSCLHVGWLPATARHNPSYEGEIPCSSWSAICRCSSAVLRALPVQSATRSR
jgi:hypothetical protein